MEIHLSPLFTSTQEQLTGNLSLDTHTVPCGAGVHVGGAERGPAPPSARRRARGPACQDVIALQRHDRFTWM